MAVDRHDLSHSADTCERLRADIDSGRTRDKVGASDPAAAPLGTDDEAGGTPSTAEQVALARRHELGRASSPMRSADRSWPVAAVAASLLVLTVALGLWFGI